MAILKCSGACVWTGVHPKSPPENGLNYIFAYINEIGAENLRCCVTIMDVKFLSTGSGAKSI